MQLQQKLSLQDYHLYLKESLFASSLYKVLRLVGCFFFGLIAYKFVNEGFTYSPSMNALTGIALLVYNLRHISYFNDRRKLNKSSYLDDLLESHTITFDGDSVSIKKGEEEFVFTKADVAGIIELPSFIIIDINELSKFPLPKNSHKKENLEFITNWKSA